MVKSHTLGGARAKAKEIFKTVEESGLGAKQKKEIYAVAHAKLDGVLDDIRGLVEEGTQAQVGRQNRKRVRTAGDGEAFFFQDKPVGRAAARSKHAGERRGGGIALQPQRSVPAHQARSQASGSRPSAARNENVLRRPKRKAPAVVVGDPAGASDASAQDDEHS